MIRLLLVAQSYRGAVMPLMIWLVLVAFFSAICFAAYDGQHRLRRLHQIPCSRCAFFTGDYRLKCTVHPSKACSEDAIHCIDYEPPHPVQLHCRIALVKALAQLPRQRWRRMESKFLQFAQSMLKFWRHDSQP